MAGKVRVNSTKLKYNDEYIEAEYEYQTTKVAPRVDDSSDYSVRGQKIMKIYLSFT